MRLPVCSAFLFVVAVRLTATAFAAEIYLPQGRTAFQTNEWIDVCVIRSTDQALSAGDLRLALSSGEGSRLEFTFPVAAGGKTRTEHLHVNGWLVRPGIYDLLVLVDGQETKAQIEVCSHIRQSSFRLINWGKANTREQQLIQGENGLGFNLFYGHYGQDTDGHFIRAGVDFMANCVMSGGHQMDLRMECDWSDPYVSRGGTRRVARRAMMDRMRPNVPGVHFYDEPGLTWHKHPATGEFGPHGVPAQIKSYVAAFAREPLEYHQVDPNNPEHVSRWKHWATWKLGLMDAAWKDAQFGVSAVRSDFLSVTQSQYGWSAFTDGYYFNVARSLPVTSGHGGYHDFGPGIFNPSHFLEMARARDRWKDCWYLPTWYGNTTADQFRLEQYLSFQTGIQGLISPPDCEPSQNPGPRQGIVESNHLMKKLGTIFTTMRPGKPPVALLYSLSQCIHEQTKDRKQNYAHGIKHGQNLSLAYLAIKLGQYDMFTVLDEDVIDGTLASDHKAVMLTSINYLDPQVISALEEFAAGGGLVLLTADCTVDIKGAKKLDVAPAMPDQATIDELTKAAKYTEMAPFVTVGKYVEGAMPLFKALKAELVKGGILPVFESDQPMIIASRHGTADVEYLFAVNATTDNDVKNDKGQPVNNVPKATTAKITLPNDGRTVYDAVQSTAEFQLERQNGQGQTVEDPQSAFDPRREPGKLVQTIRFGPGQMRVLARTRKPIGSVVIAAPIVSRDLVLDREPLLLRVAASVVDHEFNLLSGSIPLRVRIVDALGQTRFDLYRATDLGQLNLKLPLAANDPAGQWTVVVEELLSGLSSETRFHFTPPKHVRSLAGATWRAVSAEGDGNHAFQFARMHHDVTIVKGTSGFNDAAAEHLIRILQPWGVRCNVMPLADAAKSRPLTEEESRTWVGLAYAGSGQIKAGDGNSPVFAGFAVQGPVILLGNPEDNPLIAFLQKEQFLPYAPSPKFPGAGRGMFAWQRDGIGAGQESITLIAYDPQGMDEAVGTFYEAVAGIEPLTKWLQPRTDHIQPAANSISIPPLKLVAQTHLPDRVIGLKWNANDISGLAHDGTLERWKSNSASPFTFVESRVATSELSGLTSQLATPVDAAQIAAVQKQSSATGLVKFVVPHAEHVIVAYWGGAVELQDKSGAVVQRSQLSQDVTAIASNGKQLAVGLADGQVLISH